MPQYMYGSILFAEFKEQSERPWTDAATGQVRPIVSYKVLMDHGDGTRTHVYITLPRNYRGADLKSGTVYGFPCIARVIRKTMQIGWTLRSDLQPFPAPQLQ